MRKFFIVVLGAVSVAGIWACGASICDRASNGATSLQNKWAPCNDPDSGIVINFKFDKTSCEARQSSCTSDDVATINKQQDCLDKVGSCVKGQENAWFTAVGDCSKGLTISAACEGDGGF